MSQDNANVSSSDNARPRMTLGDAGHRPAPPVNEPTFHTKSNLVIPTLPLKSTTWAGFLWKLVPPLWRMRFYRLIMRLAYKAGYPDYNLRRVQSLPFGLHGKYTYPDGIAEVLATMFVRANTTIPVPDILDVIELPRDTFIIMNTLPGKRLGGGLDHMDAASVATFVEDLRGWLHQLRSLVPPPGTMVGSFLGTSSTQFRISTDDPIGPYPTIDELHQDILSRFMEPKAADQVVRKSYSKRHRLCFTHCDLNSRNMLMHNGRLSGLVDFGSSGWFPEYWEYGASSWGFTYYYPEWVDVLHKIFPQYRDEYEAEEILWDQINPY